MWPPTNETGMPALVLLLDSKESLPREEILLNCHLVLALPKNFGSSWSKVLLETSAITYIVA
jgi:hypothetical protein